MLLAIRRMRVRRVIFAGCGAVLLVLLLFFSFGGSSSSSASISTRGQRPESKLSLHTQNEYKPLPDVAFEPLSVDDFCPLEDVEPDEAWFKGVKDTYAAYQPCHLPRFTRRDVDKRVIFSCPGETFLLDADGRRIEADTREPVDVGHLEFVRAYCNWPGLGWIMQPFHNLLPVTPRWNRDHLISAAKSHRAPRPSLDVNVHHILIDAVGRDHFQRSMPHTLRLFEQIESQGIARGFDFERYHVVGWHSVQNILPMMTGHDCGGARNHKGFYNYTENIEKVRPESLLTKYYQQFGYVTAGFAEDCLERNRIGVMSFISEHCSADLLRNSKPSLPESDFLSHLKNPFESHCYNTYVENKGPEINSNLCLELSRLLEFGSDFEQQYAAVRRYLFMYIAQAHNSVRHDQVRLHIDQPLSGFLREIDFANSIVVVVADHGLHFGPHLNTLQGQREHKLPVLRIFVPTRVLAAHPDLHYNLVQNQRRLTTPWDLHATLKHITTYPAPPPLVLAPFSRSLFGRIAANRTCADAGIADEFCLCHQWTPVDLDSDTGLTELVQFVLDTKINDVIRCATDAASGDTKCPPAAADVAGSSGASQRRQTTPTRCQLQRIGRIERVELNRVATNPDTTFSFFIYYYRIRVSLAPGSRLFEMVVSRDLTPGLDENTIWGIFHGVYKPTFVNRGEVVYLRRLTQMNDAEHAEPPVPGLKSEFCVID